MTSNIGSVHIQEIPRRTGKETRGLLDIEQCRFEGKDDGRPPSILQAGDLNRVDEIVIFNTLTKELLKQDSWRYRWTE